MMGTYVVIDEVIIYTKNTQKSLMKGNCYTYTTQTNTYPALVIWILMYFH